MKISKIILGNEEGSLIVVAIFLIAIISLVGTIALKTSVTEIQTASNFMRYNIAFYNADGATYLGSELLEQNVSCPNGFYNDDVGGTEEAYVGDVAVEAGKLSFWKHEDTNTSGVSDTDRDIYFPKDYSAGEPHTNLKIGGNTMLSTGSAIQIAAGYEGTGQSMAGSGAYILYDISALHMNVLNAKSAINIQWRHMIGSEGDCIDD